MGMFVPVEGLIDTAVTCMCTWGFMYLLCIKGYFQRYALYKSTFYLLTYLHAV